MHLLVEYACTRCNARADHWVTRPVPAEQDCRTCGTPARRRFGAALLTTASPAEQRQPPASAPDPCQANADIPGACCLSPTAARSLAARARGDNRALDRELSYQEAAVKTGELDPARSPVTPFHGAPSTRPDTT